MNDPRPGAPVPVAQPQLAGIHHLKVPVSDLDASLRFYERVLGGRRMPLFDHLTPSGVLFAYMLDIPGLLQPLELRHAAGMARRLCGFDPVVFAVNTHADLTEWVAHLDDAGVANSGVLRGIVGWLLVFADPDGLSIRLYTHETHEMDPDNADFGSPWIAYPEDS